MSAHIEEWSVAELNEWCKLCYGDEWKQRRNKLIKAVTKKRGGIQKLSELTESELHYLINGVVGKINSQPTGFPGSKQFGMPPGQ